MKILLGWVVLISGLTFCGTAPFSTSSQTPPDKQTVSWKAQGSIYHYPGENIGMSVDASKGGRITSFKASGTEILQTSGEMHGSTFWPSPQSNWNWPPPEDLDSKPYSVIELSGSRLVMESTTDSRTRFQVRKIFSGNEQPAKVTVTYVITNRNQSAMSVAPWEISRVPAFGLTFFPKGSDFKYIDPNTPDLQATMEDASMFWLNHTGLHHRKAYRDGAQKWVAHLSGSILFIKRYQSDIPVSSFAPKESEIEIYSASSYVEIEQQGAYTQLEPGASFSWSVEWYGTQLPKHISAQTGSDSLVDFSRSLLK